LLQLVNVGHKSLADYTSIASRGVVDQIHRLAEPLKGTGYGQYLIRQAHQ